MIYDFEDDPIFKVQTQELSKPSRFPLEDKGSWQTYNHAIRFKRIFRLKIKDDTIIQILETGAINVIQFPHWIQGFLTKLFTSTWSLTYIKIFP